MDLRAFLRHVGVFFDPSDPVEDMVRTNAESQSIQGKRWKREVHMYDNAYSFLPI